MPVSTVTRPHSPGQHDCNCLVHPQAGIPAAGGADRRCGMDRCSQHAPANGNHVGHGRIGVRTVCCNVDLDGCCHDAALHRALRVSVCKTFERDRGWRLGAFVGGYLIIWMLPALPAYAFSWWADQAALTQPSITIVIAVGALAACGIYQLTPYKAQCLQRCRSPLSDAFKYAAYHGRLRDLRVGASHGLHCLGCCCALMALMLSFGLMNVPAMITLTAVCAIEKVWAYGPQFGRFVGVTSLAGAVAVAINPELASWLHTALVICTTQ